MCTKLFHRLSYLLLLFQTPCFAALQTVSSDRKNVDNLSNKNHAICTIHSGELQIEQKNLGNKLLVYGFIRELEPKVTNKIIPNCIMKLCVDFSRRMLPCHCIKKKYRKILPKLDNKEDHKKAIELLLCYKIEEEKDDLGTTILHKACQKGYLNIVQRLIYFNANIEIKSKHDTTPLLFACQNGRTKIAKLLLDNGANIKALNRSDCTGLVKAYRNYQKELAKYRITKGKINSYYSCLSVTCMMGHTETARLLLNNGANINAKRYDLRTALHFAVEHNNNKELVSFLIKNKANINAKDSDRRTALHIAVQYKKKDFTELLIKNGANVNAKDSDRRTALHYAVEHNNNKELVSFLIENKANINAKDSDRRTALHIAVEYNNNKELVSFLIENKANINAKDNDGKTALHISVWYKKKNFTELLMKNGANINAKDSDGRTALHYAVKYKEKDFTELLIKNGANVNAKDSDGRTALHCAVEYNKKDSTELLIKNGANVNAKDKWGENALHLACCYSGSVAMVTWLLDECKLDIETKSKNKSTPFLYTAYKGHLAIAKLLKERGANVNAKDKWGENALHYACCYSGSVAMVTWLLDECKLDIETKGYDKRTPFLCAAWGQQLAIAKLLRQRGANVHAKIFWRKNALNFSFSREMINWLSNECKLKKATWLNWFTG